MVNSIVKIIGNYYLVKMIYKDQTGRDMLLCMDAIGKTSHKQPDFVDEVIEFDETAFNNWLDLNYSYHPQSDMYLKAGDKFYTKCSLKIKFQFETAKNKI